VPSGAYLHCVNSKSMSNHQSNSKHRDDDDLNPKPYAAVHQDARDTQLTSVHVSADQQAQPVGAAVIEVLRLYLPQGVLHDVPHLRPAAGRRTSLIAVTFRSLESTPVTRM